MRTTYSFAILLMWKQNQSFKLKKGKNLIWLKHNGSSKIDKIQTFLIVNLRIEYFVVLVIWTAASERKKIN